MRLLCCLIFVALALAWPRPAHAKGEIHRCEGAGGISIFTDQKCEDMGAVPRADPVGIGGPGSPNSARLRVSSCPRTTQDLLYGIENAIAAGDVNQLAAFYHWPGTSASGSTGILKRLDTLVGHPLLSIDLLAPAPARDADGYDILVGGPERDAYGIQIIETGSGRDQNAIRTTFSLHRNIGCWWVTF